MKETEQNNGITVQNLVFPLTLVSLALFLLMAFQMSQVLKDRENLIAVKAGQEKAIEDSQRIQAQLVALIVGTQKLAGEGDENAAKIVEKLKSMGVIPQPQANNKIPAAGMMQQKGAPMAPPMAPKMTQPESHAKSGLVEPPHPSHMMKEPVSPAPVPVKETPSNEPVKP